MRLDTDEAFRRYADRVFASAFSVTRDPVDADDATQDTFLRYHTRNDDFESEAHLKAWLLRVAINRAKDLTGSFWRRNMTALEDYMETLEFEAPEDSELFRAVMALPEKYRVVIHLHYYEGYGVDEIAALLGRRAGTVKSQLSRGRTLLKHALQEEWNDDES